MSRSTPLFSPARLARGALLAAALALVSCDSVEERKNALFAQAEEQIELGNYQKALVAYRGVLRLDKNDTKAYVGMARTYEKLGKLNEALARYLVVTETDKTNTEAFYKAAQYMLLGGEVDRALKLADAAYELAPEDPDVLATKASVAYKLGNVDAALEAAHKALAIEPDHLAANVLLVTETVDRGDVDAGLTMLDDVIAKHPKELTVQLMKLRILESAGREDEVPDQLRSMMAAFPEVTEIKSTLAQWYAQRGEFKKAEDLLRDIAQASPDNTDLSLNVVQFILSTRGEEAARAELNKLIETSVDIWPFQAALAALDYSAGRVEDAKKLLRGVIDEEKTSPSANAARVQLARIEIAQGDLDTGALLVDEVLELDETNVPALALRAALEINERRYDDAALTARQALAENPRAVNLLLLAARAYELNGNTSLASEQLGLATRVADYNPQVALRYVRFLRANNQVDDAETVLDETARRAPRNLEVLRQLAEVRLQLEDWSGADAIAAKLRQFQGTEETATRIRAASLTGQKRFGESISLLEGLASGDATRDNGAVSQLVDTWIRAEDLDSAREFLARILDENPKNHEALLLRARVELVAGDEEGAVKTLEHVVELYPDHPAAHIALAQIAMRESNEAGLEMVDRGMKMTNNRPDLRLMRATIYEREGRVDDAIAEYEILYDQLPESMVVANNLASLISEHYSEDVKKLARARDIARRLRSSEIPHMQDTYGWTLYLNGEFEAALKSLKPAAEALPDNALVLYHLGMTYASLDETELALDYLGRVAEMTKEENFPHRATLEETMEAVRTYAQEQAAQ